MNYTIVSGTHRPESMSKRIAGIYKRLLDKRGTESTVLSLEDLPNDFVFSNMFGNGNNSFKPIQQIVTDTDKFIFVIPEYNGGFPGILKAFIDSCKFPESFRGKKACLVGVSSGKFGNLRGLEHFVGVAHYIKMDVLANKIYLSEIENIINDEDEITNDFLNSLMEEQVHQFISF